MNTTMLCIVINFHGCSFSITSLPYWTRYHYFHTLLLQLSETSFAKFCEWAKKKKKNFDSLLLGLFKNIAYWLHLITCRIVEDNHISDFFLLVNKLWDISTFFIIYMQKQWFWRWVWVWLCVTMGVYLEQVLTPFGSVLQLQLPVRVSSSLLQRDSQTGFFGLYDYSTSEKAAEDHGRVMKMSKQDTSFIPGHTIFLMHVYKRHLYR